jgi:hypothetical protein
MTEAWGVTRFEEGATEGITVIELFATEDLATAYRDGRATRTGRDYGVTRFNIWDGPALQFPRDSDTHGF